MMDPVAEGLDEGRGSVHSTVPSAAGSPVAPAGMPLPLAEQLPVANFRALQDEIFQNHLGSAQSPVSAFSAEALRLPGEATHGDMHSAAVALPHNSAVAVPCRGGQAV